MEILKFEGKIIGVQGESISTNIYTVPAGKVAKVKLIAGHYINECVVYGDSTSETSTESSNAKINFGQTWELSADKNRATDTLITASISVSATSGYTLRQVVGNSSTPTLSTTSYLIPRDDFLFLEGESISIDLSNGSSNIYADISYVSYNFMVIEEDL